MHPAPDNFPDVPQSLLLDTLEDEFRVVLVDVGPAGECHFQHDGDYRIVYGWDSQQAWCVSTAVDRLCIEFDVCKVDLYRKMHRGRSDDAPADAPA